MAGELHYTVFKTDFGWLGVLASAKGLQRLTLPQTSVEEARQILSVKTNKATYSPQSFTNLMGRFHAYFARKKVEFDSELDLTGCSPFSSEVWQATRLISFGETRSYKWVAEQIGRPGAARAVGHALSRNPLPIIIPCHRVVASDGTLCGFGGGLERKQQLISLEASGHTG